MMALKTAHARFSKSFLEEKMSELPGGTWIVMTGTQKRKEHTWLHWGISTIIKKYSDSLLRKIKGRGNEISRYVAHCLIALVMFGLVLSIVPLYFLSTLGTPTSLTFITSRDSLICCWRRSGWPMMDIFGYSPLSSAWDWFIVGG